MGRWGNLDQVSSSYSYFSLSVYYFHRDCFWVVSVYVLFPLTISSGFACFSGDELKVSLWISLIICSLGHFSLHRAIMDAYRMIIGCTEMVACMINCIGIIMHLYSTLPSKQSYRGYCTRTEVVERVHFEANRAPKTLGPALASRHATNHVLPHRLTFPTSGHPLYNLTSPATTSQPLSNKHPCHKHTRTININDNPLHTNLSNVNLNSQPELQRLDDQSPRANHRKSQHPSSNIHLLHRTTPFPTINRRR